VKSLDPRVNRLQSTVTGQGIEPKAALDQFGTFEVFVQPKEGKPFQHEGIVHAPDLELAYVLAKEAFTRRFTCTSLYVVDTHDVYTSPITEGDQSAYSLIEVPPTSNETKKSYEIYHLLKRGKQHLHAGTVEAATPQEAMYIAKQKFDSDKTIYNVWAIRTDTIRFTNPEEKDLWNTLPEKKFRDATDYKGGDKLKSFLERPT
jgi:ring-1,2-phenylacetyl-CoA epoxidase subunit PaaB